MNGVDMAQIGPTMAQVGNAIAGGGTHAALTPAAAPLPPRAPSKEDKALGDALCGKLREISAQPPTTRSLMQLEQTARLAREILIAAVDPYAMRGRGAPGYGIVNSGFAGAIGYDMPLPSSEYGSGPLAPSSYQENFGAAVIRELGSASGSKDEGKMSAIELVAAIALAREKNLHDVAANLEKGLAAVMGGGKLEVVLTSDEEAASPVSQDTPSTDPAVEIKEEAAQ